MNGLRMGAKYLNFKQRLATAKACHFSKLFYSIEIWGHGVTKRQLLALQSSQNKVLRWVTATPPLTSSLENLQMCGVLSVRQMIVFRTLQCGLRIIRDKKPTNLYSSLTKAGENGEERVPLLNVSRDGFYERRFWKNVFVKHFAQLPDDLRKVPDIRLMVWKRLLRNWVHDNVPYFAGDQF